MHLLLHGFRILRLTEFNFSRWLHICCNKTEYNLTKIFCYIKWRYFSFEYFILNISLPLTGKTCFSRHIQWFYVKIQPPRHTDQIYHTFHAVRSGITECSNSSNYCTHIFKVLTLSTKTDHLLFLFQSKIKLFELPPEILSMCLLLLPIYFTSLPVHALWHVQQLDAGQNLSVEKQNYQEKYFLNQRNLYSVVRSQLQTSLEIKGHSKDSSTMVIYFLY